MSTRAANRYAKALLSLASDQSQEDLVQKDMLFITESIASSKELQVLLSSPVFKISEKKSALKGIFDKNKSALTNNLLDLLATNKRMPLLPLISKQYSVLFNELKSIEKAVVTTAFPIDEAMREKVLAKTAALVGDKKISLENIIDESIIGGFILRVGDIQIDASILNKIGKLKRELKNNLYLSN